jgi:acyl-CoA synthetase (AMP-forming)/AMP-acid ligase II
LKRSAQETQSNCYKCETNKDDLAAIIFTTGSTGPPKGVQYTHSIFAKQLELIREYYKIGPDDIDQPAFPLFALFSIALGACAVIPQMNPAKPAQVNPAKFIKTILDHRVTYSFGSPAIWNVVSHYCLNKRINLPLKKVLMAGAPVSGELVTRVKSILTPGAEVHTPYGATESLPVSSITGTEIVENTWPETRKGKGTCVGKPLPGIDIQIIVPSDSAISTWDDVEILDPYKIGEIVVRGDVVTKAYDHNDKENLISKIKEADSFWHRIGDMGYFDSKGRLWFCGRKAHRVITSDATMFTIPCEAVFNEHPEVFRSALVGVGEIGKQLPVIIVEPFSKNIDKEKLITQLQVLAQNNTLTASIEHFLVHDSFPVDIRHNAKIFREKLGLWAEKQLLHPLT